MDRRAFLAAATLAAASSTAARAEDAPEEAPTYELAVVGLPVVIDDRIRNYIFVRLLLHLADGQDPTAIREMEPHIRDSVVRMGHRRPFSIPGEANRLNAGAIAGHAMAACNRVYGRGVVRRVEVTEQQPQRRVSLG